MNNRTDIQILRGLAVLAVMLAHFGPIFPGGFLGVDVFFVISGFVITFSLARAMRNSNSSRIVLLNFYKKRFFRLVPALAVVLVAVLLVSFFLLSPSDFEVQAEMSLWSLVFAGNLGAALLDGGGYFAEPLRPNWLLHLWSLGVEEQFYLAFPLFFLLLQVVGQKGVRPKAITLLALATTLAFIPSLFDELSGDTPIATILNSFPFADQVFGYYSPVTRAWQFMVGALAAQIVLSRNHYPSVKRFQDWALLLLCVSFLVFPESNLHPGPATLVPTFLAFTILLSPLSENIVTSRALRPLKWLGDRSYSAYLWHWPVWSVVTSFSISHIVQIGLSFSLTIVLAWGTHRYVETPWRFSSSNTWASSVPRGKANRRRLAAFSLAATVLFVPAFAASVQVALKEKIQELRLEKPEVPRFQETFDCLKIDCKALGVDALLVGDSHAGALFGQLQSSLLQFDITLGAVIQPGCFHLDGEQVFNLNSECIPRSSGLSRVVDEVSPAWIFVHGYSAGRLTEVNSGRSREIQVARADAREVTYSDAQETYKLAADEFLEEFQIEGRNILFISSLPDFFDNLTSPSFDGEAAKVFQLLFAPELEYQLGSKVSREEFTKRHGGFEAVDRLLALREGVHQVSGWDAVCAESVCSQRTPDGDFIFSDSDHLSEFGASRLAQSVTEVVRGLLSLGIVRY